MNILTLTDPILSFGDNHHPVCTTGFSFVKDRISCTLDTGFSLGFAFSIQVQKKLQFTNGYFASLMLGNGKITKGVVFIAELRIQRAESMYACGNVSIVCMERSGDPLIGIEAMKLWSPLVLDWNQNSVLGNLG